MAAKTGKTRKKPSARRAKLEQEIRSNPEKSDVQAAMDAGYAKSTAHSEASEMAAPIRASMAAAFGRKGITEDFLAGTTKTLLVHKDPHVRLRAVHMSIQVLDGYPAPKEPTEDSRPITIVFGKSLSDMMPAEKPNP